MRIKVGTSWWLLILALFGAASAWGQPPDTLGISSIFLFYALQVTFPVSLVIDYGLLRYAFALRGTRLLIVDVIINLVSLILGMVAFMIILTSFSFWASNRLVLVSLDSPASMIITGPLLILLNAALKTFSMKIIFAIPIADAEKQIVWILAANVAPILAVVAVFAYEVTYA
ncbi:MAG: hypothetical protein HY706_16795 [Candidatus Hydrogenedentes bacterium]|nr:hypothetical protein [Candidatus Hydrogenedentota bacterium]